MDYKEIETLSDERMDELFHPYYSNLALSLCVLRKVSDTKEKYIDVEWKGKNEIDFEKIDGSDELYAILKTLGFSEEDAGNVFVDLYTSEAGLNVEWGLKADVAKLADAIYYGNIDLSDDKLCSKLKAMQEYDPYRYEDLATAIEEEARFDFYEGMTGAEWEEQVFDEQHADLYEAIEDSGLSSYVTIDFEQMARDDGIFEADDGILIER